MYRSLEVGVGRTPVGRGSRYRTVWGASSFRRRDQRRTVRICRRSATIASRYSLPIGMLLAADVPVQLDQGVRHFIVRIGRCGCHHSKSFDHGVAPGSRAR